MALGAAITLSQVDSVPVLIEQHLDLDMASSLQITLEHEPIIGESALRLATCRDQRVHDLRRGGDAVDALAATTARRLDEQRIADPLRLCRKDGVVLLVAVVARHDRNPEARRATPRRGLVRHGGHGASRRSHPGQPRVLRGFREGGVLGEEPIAGMYGIGSGRQRSCDEGRAVEVRADRKRRVHAAWRQVAGGLHANGSDAEPARRACHATDDLAAVGDQKRPDPASWSGWGRISALAGERR